MRLGGSLETYGSEGLGGSLGSGRPGLEDVGFGVYRVSGLGFGVEGLGFRVYFLISGLS